MAISSESYWINWELATSPHDGLVASRRELRPGARLLPQCGTPKYLVQPATMSKTLHQSQATFLCFALLGAWGEGRPPTPRGVRCPIHSIESFNGMDEAIFLSLALSLSLSLLVCGAARGCCCFLPRGQCCWCLLLFGLLLGCPWCPTAAGVC